MTLEVLSKKLDDYDIEIPEFQRSQVWKIKQASKLIESFLLGLPVPQVFFYLDKASSKLLVVDGQQRLRSINAFFNGEYKGRTFRLTGVNPEWEGRTYEELSESDKRRLRNSVLRSTTFEQVDPADDTSVIEVFNRLNTGGMSLTLQEVRNAVIGGNLNALIKELNNDPRWRTLFGRSKIDLRQRDIEAILRLLALNDNYTNYRKPMNEFLNTYLRDNDKANNQELLKVRSVFESTIGVILDRIGSDAFIPNKTINMSVADAVFAGIAHNITNLPDDLSKRYNRLLRSKDFIISTEQHTTDADRVKSRIALAINVFRK